MWKAVAAYSNAACVVQFLCYHYTFIGSKCWQKKQLPNWPEGWFDLCLHFLGAVSEHHKSDHIECFHLCTQSSSVSALKPADFFTMQMIHLLLQKRNHL